MRKIYFFFEAIYFQLNKINLKGQTEDNIANFAAFNLTLLIDFNIISLLFIFDKLKLIPFFINHGYKVIAFVLITYLSIYLLFVRKNKYKIIREKYLRYDKIHLKNIKYLLALYIIITFVLYILVIFI